ncbi:metalloprotease [Micractinium conductrix]|uniref:Metalloprotease n=1 Tax=Micractinium conductrix TaxID=554055 RepID=A0A2P6V9E5_9CHLO|nr:metalloprotease [Micractinium conductrix]|eukprot:PSC70701.1 metalloprotease [Micractinium conductrix]
MAEAETRTYGAVQSALAAHSKLAAAVERSAFPNAGVTLPITFHVVLWNGRWSTSDLAAPPLKPQQIADQVAQLNRDYNGTGLQFASPKVRFHTRKDWADTCWAKLGEILAAVNTAPAAAVNVIVCDLASSGGILGVMPDMPNGQNERDPSQAVAVDFRSMPGGPYTRYSGGRTLTHELGHYFGLLHTFGDGSCATAGGHDGIADTPAQRELSNGCPVGKDSCPNQPGKDAVNNFMDYSDDACMTSFSLGQAARMQAVMLQFRPTLLARALRRAGAGNSAAGTPPPPKPQLSASRRAPPPPPRRLAAGGQQQRPCRPPSQKRQNTHLPS